MKSFLKEVPYESSDRFARSVPQKPPATLTMPLQLLIIKVNHIIFDILTSGEIRIV